MTTLILVRHGQSETNLSHTFTGQSNTPLTPLGVEQAKKSAAYLQATYPVDVIYSSDLDRSMDTARPAAEAFGLPIVSDPALREINVGLWEGMPYLEIPMHFPETYHVWMNDYFNAHPDGGESVKELYERVTSAVEGIVRKNPGKCIAVFTHATPVRMMYAHWTGVGIHEPAPLPHCSNASLTVAEYDDDGHFERLICFNYDKHQGDGITQIPAALI